MISGSSHVRILRIRQVTQAIGLSRSSIYRLMELGMFPKPIKIGINAVGWDTGVIADWIVERKQAAIH